MWMATILGYGNLHDNQNYPLVYISQGPLGNRWHIFFKGEAEKNFIHEGVGRVKINSRKKGAPPGVGMMALGSHYHPQQEPREGRGAEPSEDCYSCSMSG